MKKYCKILICILIVSFAGILCACLPPNYTREQVRETTKELTPLAEKWFSDNMPGVKILSADAYKDGVNLMKTLTGKYLDGKNEYCFMYDAANNRMFIEKGYDEAEKIILAKTAERFGTDSQNIRGTFHSMKFESDYAVMPEYPEKATVIFSKRIPSDYSAQRFADEVINGEIELWYSVEIFDANMPGNVREVMDSVSNCISVTYNMPIDWEYSGFSSVTYSNSDTKYKYTVLTKLNNRLYGGYVYEIKGGTEEEALTVAKEDLWDPIVVQDENKQIVLKVPRGAIPVVFSDKKKNPILHYELNGRKNEKELQECEKNLSYKVTYEGYDDFMGAMTGKLMLPKSKRNCYYAYFVPNFFPNEYVITYK